jgi:hypothetical protein
MHPYTKRAIWSAAALQKICLAFTEGSLRFHTEFGSISHRSNITAIE